MTASNECGMLACRVCTDPGCDHACHLSALTTAPAAASPSPARVDAAAGGAADASWGSGAEVAPAVAAFPRPDWWGERGCRHAGDDHVCLDAFGRPVVDGGRPCVSEARAAMADLFDAYRAVTG